MSEASIVSIEEKNLLLKPKTKQEELEFAVIGYSLNFQFCWNYFYPTEHFFDSWTTPLTAHEKSLDALFKSAHKLRECIDRGAPRKRAELLMIKSAMLYIKNLPFPPKNIMTGLDSLRIVERRLYDSVKELSIFYTVSPHSIF